jgi:hypothetical protein
MRLIEFLEDEHGVLSSSRLLQIMVCGTLCACLLMEMWSHSPNENIVVGIAGIAAALSGGTYSMSKWRETIQPKDGKVDDTDSK